MPAYEYYVNPTAYDGDNVSGAERVPTGGQAANYWYLPLKVYLPDTPGEYPVIVFSHGFRGDYTGVENLADGYEMIQGLTAAGYIVIAPTHADTANAEGPAYAPQYSTPTSYPGATSEDAIRFAFRADDIALAINFLQAEAETNLRQPDGAGLPNGATTGYSMDLDAPIVAVGHSFGSNTVALLAGADIHQEGTSHFSIPVNSDIDAVISLSGTGIAGEPIFDADSFNGVAGAIARPYLRLSGWNDITADLADVGDRYAPYFLTEEDSASTTWAVDIEGATHAQFVDPDGDKDATVTAAEEARFAKILEAIISFADYHVRGDSGALAALEALDLDDPDNYDLSAGGESLTLGSAGDVYLAHTGDDTISGEDGDDILYGMEGGDSLNGGPGNDVLAGGAGTDQMIGGLGDDVYFVDATGDSVIDVTSGAQTYGGADTVNAGVSFTLGYYIEALILTGDDDLSGDGYDAGPNSKEETLVGNEGNNVLRGFYGDDYLDGGKGDDTLQGGAEDDTLVGGQGVDRLEGGDGQDELDGGVGGDTLIGGAGYDIIVEGETPDGGYDYVDAGDGNDWVNAGVAHDTVLGGNGDDTINEAGAGNDTLSGDAGNDLITGDGVGDVEGGEDSLAGGDGADTLDGRYGEDSLDGGIGNDLLVGGAGNDDLYGDAGVDTVVGDAGADTLDGGTGNDSLVGGAGDDDYYVDSATDAVLEASSEGHDRVLASASYTLSAETEDLIIYGAAVDAVGNTADNVISGNPNANIIIGGYGNDTISAGDGGDEVYGGGDNDLLYGNDDNDTVVGGNGADTVIGGQGVDRLSGGFGDDVFAFSSAAEVGLSLGMRDIVIDFDNTGEADRIDLAGIDAITGGSDNPFTFIGAAAFSNTAGELRYLIFGPSTFVLGDVDGNGAADFMLQLTGSHTLTGADFTL